ASTLQIFEKQTVLIFDFGGGSLDLALVDFDFDEQGPLVRERALGGCSFAGDRLDEAFRDYLLERDPTLRRAYDREVGSGSAYDRWRATNNFTIAKIALSAAPRATLRLPGFEVEVTRSELNQSIEPELGEALLAVRKCLERGGLAPQEVGQVILTGGSSLVPA